MLFKLLYKILMDAFQCQLCNLKFNNIELYVKHVRLMHDNKLNIKCMFSNCNFVTSKLRYLCRHFSNSNFLSENILIPKTIIMIISILIFH